MNKEINYRLNIVEPHKHQVNVKISFTWPEGVDELELFMPSWSPGSYLMREYGRFVRQVSVVDESGQNYFFKQKDKGTWSVSRGHEGLSSGKEVHFSYSVYCHELTVRTSHVDRSHAFIHGPSIFMGVRAMDQASIKLTIQFPHEWTKVSTGLKDISESRSEFIYSSDNYDDFIDCPIEIGTQDTDGFKLNGKDHELAFFGSSLPHGQQIKSDIQKIVEHISNYMGGMPYDRYVFITHLVPGLYGGLEHKNSTALQFSSLNLANRDDYINWLCLVSHEYFHTWNVKRIRPKTFGPFDYQKEVDSSLLWLAEGLTSFMDELFVYQAGLISLEEYLNLQVKNLKRYYQTPGRKFHSLEESGFNAWNTLYKPVENSANSSISYYLKGGIAFFALNAFLIKEGKSIKDFIDLLWERYLDNPTTGMTKTEVFSLVEKVGGKDILNLFESWIESTEELPISNALDLMGLEMEYDKPASLDFGFSARFEGDRVFVKSVELDRSAYNCGLNPEDEVLAMNQMRIEKSNFNQLEKYLLENEVYDLTISRLGYVQNIKISPMKKVAQIKSIKVKDLAVVQKALG